MLWWVHYLIQNLEIKVVVVKVLGKRFLIYFLLLLISTTIFFSLIDCSSAPQQATMPLTGHRSECYIELTHISLIFQVQVVMPHNKRHVQGFLYIALGCHCRYLISPSKVQVVGGISKFVRVASPVLHWERFSLFLSQLTKRPTRRHLRWRAARC